jgi:hypothetical protein
MVYYALGVLSPNYFYLSACTICLLVALSIGSSWTMVAMIGVGLMSWPTAPWRLVRPRRRSPSPDRRWGTNGRGSHEKASGTASDESTRHPRSMLRTA